MAVAPVPNLIC